ncbi:MAG: DHH family phosphoesterase, partial [Lachnospiraceae bacterium]|nr:DHH family phosphoesterase [Lachnospiraceae bacterium]
MKLSELLVFNDIVIQCHDNPDADALASGYALYLFFKRAGKETEFIYRGLNKVGKSNLMIMLSELEIPVKYMPEFDRVPELLVTVDCQYGQRNVTTTDAKNIAIIDHHQVTVDLPKLSEVRSNIGSCATVVWDMMREEGFPINSDK